jgi:hypothetical protein
MASELWMHDLRNAVNTALTASSVVRLLLQKGDVTRALQFSKEVEEACERCRALIVEKQEDEGGSQGPA